MNGGSFKKHSPLKAVENSTVPMIFIHGKEDRYIPYESAEELYNNCVFKQKELVFVEKAGHVASCEKNPDKYFGSVLDFYNKIKFRNKIFFHRKTHFRRQKISFTLRYLCGWN